MKDKKECEIVQDLLFNYVDGILNPESKKLVEEHLTKCVDCQSRLKQINDDTKDKNVKEQIELDYLKRIRVKTKIKTITTAIVTIILICFIMFFNNFIKINTIINRAEKSLQSNNFYKETSQMLIDGETFITKEYYKDGKYKSVYQVYTDSGVETQMIEYTNTDTDERIYINETEKKAVIEKGELSKIKNNIKYVPFVINRNSLSKKIGTTFTYTIDVDTYDYGKEYYILRNKKENARWEIWIDKETGLPIKEINRNAIKTFYTGTNVVREVKDMVLEYNYEFNKVTDEDVDVPDLSGYTVETTDWNFEIPSK